MSLNSSLLPAFNKLRVLDPRPVQKTSARRPDVEKRVLVVVIAREKSG